MSGGSRSRATSWLTSSNREDTDFGLANLPYCIFSRPGSPVPPAVGVAIGDFIVDVCAAVERKLLPRSEAAKVCSKDRLNDLMQLPRADREDLRAGLIDMLREGSAMSRRASELQPDILVPIDFAKLHLPVAIGDYTDFYASIHHATNVGKMFRPDNPLLPNYKYVPIGYHGRASSIVVSGTEVRRPVGQTRASDAADPAFGPSRMLDYESELGLFIGKGNELGSIIPLTDADNHIFGYCLVNDWSARDIQSWEYQPLGPFLAKNFATTISPWVVPSEAVEDFRSPAPKRPSGDPQPLEYLSAEKNEAKGGMDAKLLVYLSSKKMREEQITPMLLSETTLDSMYWTMPQLVTHHASNGCNLKTGDLIASGTVSGPDANSLGCLLEITRRGANPVMLPTGEPRKFLEDGDEVIMRGYFGRVEDGVGFGECRGVIAPSISG